MWFFMILSYLMVGVSGLGLALIGLNHYFSFWAQNHITFDLLVSIIFIAAQTLVMFFFLLGLVSILENILNRARRWVKNSISKCSPSKESFTHPL